ncbi:Ig-like domain-containing protein [Corallococcus llansteffanensis]|uniref:Peptidase M4 domain-containing protein n=1 Tax=Corallococcus llansteffanensis TaxID=2316731 RepID=A0A3A8NY66_9BACT|nr:Ig-like domain-containing protein [Corallococcus llansteffanensis]RKH47181.1 hypothetical protein D7V93_34155 [Corallococcus llansteffanensis]
MGLRQGLLSGLFFIVSSCGPTSLEEPAPDKALARTRAERLVAERGFDLREVSLVPDGKGNRHALHFRGVPIWGLEAKTAEEEALFSNARFESAGAVETEARLTEAQAWEAALAALKDSTAKVEAVKLVLLPTEEQRLRKDAAPSFVGSRNAADFERVVTGLRLIYRLKLSTGGDARRRWMAQVDARSGEVLRLEPLEHMGVTGTPKKAVGNGYYSGRSTISVLYDAFARVNRLRDPHTNIYEAYVVVEPRSYAYVEYVSSDLNLGDGLRYSGAGPLGTNGETAAVDAYSAVNLAWSVYETFLGRNGPTGNGTAFEVQVHVPMANAAYFPDEYEPSLAFGYRDLAVRPLAPMTTTDIVGHEMAHDFFARELAGDPANIPRERSEQAGLNEGTGDIFGFVTELLRDAKRASSTSTYIDGVVLKASNYTSAEETGTAGRSILEPNNPEWVENIGSFDEHDSGGPLGRMFMLLSYGCGTNPQSPWSCRLVPEGFGGLGPTEALRIWALAVQLMPLGSDYLQARQAALAAATTLDGTQGGNRMRAVAYAFAAINVGYKPDLFPPQTTLSCRQVLQDIECTGTITDAEIPGQYSQAPRLVLDGGTQIKTLPGWQFTQTLSGAGLASGNHTVQLQAWDYWQNPATRTVTVLLDKTPPTVASVTVSGLPKQPRYSVTASDASGIRVVEFGEGAQVLSGVFAPPYEYALDTSTWTDGIHDVVIQVSDTYLNATVRHQSLKVDNTPPTVAMTVGSGQEAPFNVNVTVTDASDVARVDFKVDGVVFATRTHVATTYLASYIPNDPLAHNLTVEVTDAFGNKRTTGTAAPLDRTPPQVSFLKEQVSSLVKLTVGVSDGCGVQYPYALYVDGILVGQPTTPGYVLEFGASMAAGTHAFQAIVSDKCGNTANYQTTFFKDLTPPVITGIVRDDSQPKKPKFTVQCTDTEGVHHVEMRENSGVVAQIDTTAPYEFVVDTTSRLDGNYTMLFQCSDINGVASAPETRMVTADNTGPTHSLTVYGAGRSYFVSAGTVADPRGVQSVVLSGGLLPGFSITLTQAPYGFQWNIPGTGTLQTQLPFTVTAKDTWGNTSGKTLYCTVNTASTTPNYLSCVTPP